MSELNEKAVGISEIIILIMSTFAFAYLIAPVENNKLEDQEKDCR